MKKSNLKQLRKKAEQHLQTKSPLQNNQFSENETHKMVHELQVHQVELEMQNDELLRTNVELETSRNNYASLFDFAPIGYFILDKNGIINKVNLAGSKLLEVERKRLISNRFQSFIHNDHLKEFYNYLIDVFNSKEKLGCELQLISNKGKEIYVQVESLVLNDPEKDGYQCLTTIVDITEKKNASQALLKAQMKLEHKVKNRTASLERSNMELQLEIQERIKVEKALEDNNMLLHGIIEGTSDVIFVKDANGNYLLMNSAAAKIVGISKEKTIGKNDLQLFPKDLAIELIRLDKQVMESGKSIVQEIISSDERIFFVTKSPYKDSEGNTIGVIGIAHDITEIKKAEKEKLRLLLMLENSYNEIYLVDAQTYQYVYANKGACNNLGYTLEEIKNLTLLDIKPQYTRENVDQLVKPLMEEKEEKMTFYCEQLRGNGTKYPVEVHLQVMREEKNTYFLIVAVDITDRKKIEKLLEEYAEDCRLNQLLVEAKAEELVEVNQRLRQSEKELKLLNSNKDKFLYIMAHDLKSPFNSLLGSSEFLKNYFDEMKSSEVKTYIHNINYLAKNFRSILDDLLDWSSLQHGTIRFNPEEIDLKDKINSIISLLQHDAREKGIQIIFETCHDSTILGDKYMVTSVLQNIIFNAIKFTCKGGTVAINCEDYESEILVKVSDNGIGMDEKTLNKIFRIETHHSTKGTANEKGTGLGMILCKEFIKKHGGRLWVESEAGVGTTFFFTFPKKLNSD